MFAAKVSTRAAAVVIDGAVVGAQSLPPQEPGSSNAGKARMSEQMMAHRPNMVPPREQMTGNIGGQRVESTRFVGV